MSITHKTLVAAALGVAAAVAHAGVVGFTGAYAPGNWTTTLTGSAPGGGAPAGATNDGTTLTLRGGDDFCESLFAPAPSACQILYGIAAPGPELNLLFSWSYTSNDLDGPQFDTFGIVVDGVYTQLSNSSGAATQSGSYAVALAAGSQFAWYIDCDTCILGNAVATITNFQAVPEPASLALVGFGIAAAAAGGRRRRAA